MKKQLISFVKIFKPWFIVDSRSLGIFRVLLGILSFIDIYRRWEYIDIFYTNNSIITANASSSYYKMFTLLTTFSTSWEVHLFFLIGLLFSIFLIIGFKTKLSHLICAIVIISIHNRAIILENAGDMFLNSLLIWTLFLPLGISYSIDALKNSLSKFKENSINDLNNREFGLNKSQSIFSLAFFAILYQISSIYFFTSINKTGYDWSNGSAVYKMYQLDTFITPIGFYIRDFISSPISKILTFGTVYIELIIPILLFIPFYSYIFRTIAILLLSSFHIIIRMSIKVGLFSFTMITTFALLIDKKVYELLDLIINKYLIKNKQYILFYDSDCGFCHYSIRVIKRLDIYNRIIFADKTYKGKKPVNYNELQSKTAILFAMEDNKIWTKHEAFGKVLLLIPFGFIIAWIFFIPIISKIFEYIYNIIAVNRTKISIFLGYSACGAYILDDESRLNIIDYKITYHNISNIALKFTSSIMILILIIATFNYNLVGNDAVNKFMKANGYKKFIYKRNLKRICYYPRMIQRWNMFSPTVLGTDKTVIVEATLHNGEIINPFTGQSPVLDNLDYKNLWHDHTQFWRKFFTRLSKKNNKKYVDTFERWLKRSTNDYFEKNLGGQKIKSVRIWSLSERNNDINKNNEYKVYKQLLNKPKNVTN